MARFILIVVSAIILNSFSIATDYDEDSAESSENTTSPPKCGDDEILDTCPVDCPSDYCPRSRHNDQSKCPKPKKCPPASCKCGFNSRRARNGTCIPTRNCPPFKCKGPHEVYNPCPPYCPGEKCSQATRDGKCHLPGRLPVLECKPACRCKKNYWRLNGICVPYARCPKNTNTTIVKTKKPKAKSATRSRHATKSPKKPQPTTTPATLTCGDNEVVDDCPSTCLANYCPKNRYVDQSPCPRPKICPPPRCRCGINFRRANNGSCISTKQCPSFECNRENEEYNPCPPYCPGEDCSEATSDGKCNIKGRILIPVICKPACRCKKNFFRLNGNCVPYNQCPNTNSSNTTEANTPKPTDDEDKDNGTTPYPNDEPTEKPLTCKDNEVVDKCPVHCPSDNCPKSRYDSQLDCPEPKKCPPAACKCGFNSRRAVNGTCISTRNCPPFACDGPNEEYNACPPYCPGENCSQATADGECHTIGRILIVVECQPACRCKKNFWRLNGICVPYDQCPGGNGTIPTTTPPTVKPLPKCGPYEMVDHCPVDCPINYCPKSEGVDFSTCPRPEKCPPPECRCGLDTHRTDNGSCVPIQECPPFECTRPNEEYRACYPESAGEDCADATTEEGNQDTSVQPTKLICKPACRCKKGYWRLNGACVPYEECKPSPCGKNEHIVQCKNSCSDTYCPKSEKDTEPRFCTQECRGPGCACLPNHMRAENGTCIPTRDCPPFDCSARPFERFVSCPPYCPSDSCRDATPTGKCPRLGRIGTLLICNPKCRCIEGYWRNDDGICIPYEKCPKICPLNEEYNNCTQKLCRVQNCTQKDDAILCLNKITSEPCNSGCVCKEGYLRDENGDCISQDKCPAPKPCGANEILVSCANACTEKYCPITEADTKPRLCTAECRGPGCNCQFNYSRAKNGTCIPTRSCPPIKCNANEMYDPCPPACPSDSCTQATPTGKCPTIGRIGIVVECRPQCRCTKGYWRNEKGVCIPYAKCPGICPTNEVYTNCTQSLCRPLNCTDIANGKEQFICEPDKVEGCQGGCVCKNRFLRVDNGTCVADTECANSNPKKCPGPHEEYTDCKETCPGDTCAALTAKITCDDEECCEPGCVCETGFRRQTATGPCIPICKCKEMIHAPMCQTDKN